MFSRHTVQSLFHPPASPISEDLGYMKPLALVVRWMIAASAWQGTVGRLEREFIGIRQGVAAGNTENERAFRSLTDFRRSLIDAHRLFVETRGRIVDEIASVSSWVERLKTTNEKSSAARFEQQADARNLPRTSEELDETISTIMASLNEEIQLVIGYAQVQDAKFMREQTAQTVRQTELALDLAKSAKQQAEWTILLAMLAAFYPPLTLVTGIYGMNIVEITGSGASNKNWVLGSWAVAFVLTLGGCAAGWTSVKWWKRRKDESGKTPKEEEAHREKTGTEKHEEKPDGSQMQGRRTDEQEAGVEREADLTNERRKGKGKKTDTKGEAEWRGVANQSENDSTTQTVHGMLKRLRHRGRNALASAV